MPAPAIPPDMLTAASATVDSGMELSRLQYLLPPLLSVIAGMVDLTGFFTLGKLFTAHVTGNLVLAAAAAVGGGPLNVAVYWQFRSSCLPWPLPGSLPRLRANVVPSSCDCCSRYNLPCSRRF